MKKVVLDRSRRKDAESLTKVLTISCAVAYMNESLDKDLVDYATKLMADNSFVSALGIARPWEALKTAIKAKNTTKIQDSLEKIAEKIRDKKDVIKKDIDLSTDNLKLLGNVVSIVRTGSNSAMNSMANIVIKQGDALVARLFKLEDVLDQQTIIKELDSFVRKTFRKSVDQLTVEDKNRLREKDPVAYKTFLRLQRERGQAVKDYVRNMVLAEAPAGQLMVPVSTMLQYLKRSNIEHKIPSFKGFIGPNMELYTSERKKLNGSITGRVEYNPAYDPKKDNTYVFLHYPLFGKGEPQRIYTIDYKQDKTADKFNVVGSLTKVIEDVRKKWMKDLKADIKSEQAVCALILELIYITSARIGSQRGATGISSLLVKEYSARGSSSFSLNYVGKKGIKQKHVVPLDTVVTRHLAGMLNKLSVGKKPTDLLMTYGKGKPITGTKVNNYLRSLGVPAGVTVHKFRHARGSILARKILDGHPFGKGTRVTDAQANKWILEALKKVGTELGHMNGDKVTATTAIQNYIDPNILREWFDGLGVRPNNAIQAAINKASKSTD